MKTFKTRLKRFFIVLLIALLMFNPYIINFFGFADADNSIIIDEIKVGDTFAEGERVRIMTPYIGDTKTLKLHFGNEEKSINSIGLDRVFGVFDKIVIEDDGETIEEITSENNEFGVSLENIIAFENGNGIYLLNEGNGNSYKACKIYDNDYETINNISGSTLYVSKDFYDKAEKATFEFYIRKEELLRSNFSYNNEIFDFTFPTLEKDEGITVNWQCVTTLKDADGYAIAELYFVPVTNGYMNNFYEYESEEKNDYVLTKTYISNHENASVYEGQNKGIYTFDKWQAKQTGDNFTNFYALYKAPINITKQPQDVTVKSGATATFSVDSDAADAIYTWYGVNNVAKDINIAINDFVFKDGTYVSNIAEIDNAESSMSFDIEIPEAAELKIDYDISSEINFDIGKIVISGPNEFQENIEASGQKSDVAIVKLPSQGQYNVQISYKKDSSQSGGSDCLKINSIYLNNNKATFENDKINLTIPSNTEVGTGKELKIENVLSEKDGTKYKCMVSSPNTEYVAVSNVATLYVKEAPTANFYLVETDDLTKTQFDSRTLLGTGKVKSISNTLQGEQAVVENIESLPRITMPIGKDLVFFYSNFSNGAYEVYGTYVDAYTTSYEVKYNGPVVKVENYPEKTDFTVLKITTLRNGGTTKETVTDFDILNEVEKVGNNVINISVDEEKLSATIIGGDVPSGFEKEVKNSSQNSVTFSYKVNNLNNGTDLKVSVYVDGKFYKNFSENNKEITLTNLKSNKEYNVTINFENNFGQAKEGLEFKVKTLPEVKSLRAVYSGTKYIGDQIDKTKVKVYAVFEDGTEKELNTNDITFGTKTLIEKEGNNNFDIKYGNIEGSLVIDGIGIKQITGIYNDDAYVYQTLNKNNFKFEITYKDNIKKEFKYDDFTKVPSSLRVENVKEQAFTFEYKNVQTQVTINPITYNYITATYPSNKEKVGTKLDNSKVTVTLYYNKNSKNEVKSEVIKNFVIKGNDTIVEGKNEYNVTFEGLKTTFSIEGYKETASNTNTNNNTNNNSSNKQETVTPTPTVLPDLSGTPVTTSLTPVPTEAQTRVQTGDVNNVFPYIFGGILFVVLSGVIIYKLKKKD